MLGAGPGAAVLLLTVFPVVIGPGSVVCEKLSGYKVEIGRVSIGSIGMMIFGVHLYFAHSHNVGQLSLGVDAVLTQIKPA